MEDVEALVLLRLALVHEIDHLSQDLVISSIQEATRQYFIQAIPTEAFIAWVAETHGQIVATSGLIFFQKPPSTHNLSGREAYILNMYTLPAWRKQGIAALLFEQLMACAKQREAHRIWMYATQEGKPLYEKAGFVLKTRQTLEMELIW